MSKVKAYLKLLAMLPKFIPIFLGYRMKATAIGTIILGFIKTLLDQGWSSKLCTTYISIGDALGKTWECSDGSWTGLLITLSGWITLVLKLDDNEIKKYN